ncbi:MAG: HAD family hydrolase [Erysipelotrichaceae bacterium]|nr:HAD family hydrolase [Erysipelotrichaceae bacterium]
MRLEGKTTIFFDLDGTLLPMDEEHFTATYFRDLCKVTGKYGLEPKESVAAVWAGVKAMVNNDGTVSNDVRFWDCFFDLFKDREFSHEAIVKDLEHFYATDFAKAKVATEENPYAPEVIRKLKEKGLRLVLATNPIFPLLADYVRLSFIGLDPKDFEFISAYENSSFCKPNPKYYTELLEKLGLKAEEVLMIGNDVKEDVEATKAVGIDSILITDCLLGDPEGLDVEKMSFAEFAGSL